MEEGLDRESTVGRVFVYPPVVALVFFVFDLDLSRLDQTYQFSHIIKDGEIVPLALFDRDVAACLSDAGTFIFTNVSAGHAACKTSEEETVPYRDIVARNIDGCS